MPKPSVLITSASRKVWLVKAFREAEWWVTAQDKDHDAVALRFADDFDTINGVFRNSFDLIIPTRDAELVQAYKDNKWNWDHLNTCLDKFAFHRFCKQHGFRTPEVYFVKPRISASGKETECVWQELIEGEEMSIDLFADFNSTVICAVPRLRLKTVNGESWISLTVSNERVLQESIKLATSLKLVGHNVLQCFWNGTEAIWTDVNCRFGGGSSLAIKAGCNSPLWLRELIEGKKVKPRIGEYEVGLKMLRYTEDYFENTSHR